MEAEKLLLNVEEKQVIIYGAPGTGKSYEVQENLEELGFSQEEVFRVVFFHDYTYSDFVGYISPSAENLTTLEYVFAPGPFTLALRMSLSSNAQVCLLIEELNRGNSAAIFGDVFQLLDRDSVGVSSYTISNPSIREYLNMDATVKQELDKKNVGENDIFLPKNFHIICTMNTADQNVFALDTAFKRRFKMKYIPLFFSDAEPRLNKLNKISSQNIFSSGRTWADFAQVVNGTIDIVNSSIVSISEDKKLGPYFVDEVDVSCRQAFCDKVIYYLKNDVFKYCDQFLNESYETIYDQFVLNEKDVFKYFHNLEGITNEI